MIQSRKELAGYIDHTLLKSTGTSADLKRLCAEAREWGFCTVCVEPRWLKLVSEELKGSAVLPITVVGFPLGVNQTSVKVFETQEAIRAGAKEIDMVIDLGAYKSGLKKEVEEDIAQVCRAAGSVPVKVILETCYLNLDETSELAKISVAAGAAFVKTSTGFGSGGATLEHVRTMRAAVGPSVGVKASGGIKDLKSALAMIEAGASRIGASSSVEIVKELTL